MVYRIIIFLVINFGALAIGSRFTKSGVQSDWYSNLSKAPWSPPGWVFGAAWTTIMICFAVYMAFAWREIGSIKLLIGLFVLQLILNISWNPVFFYYQNPLFALMIIAALTGLMGFFLIYFWSEMHFQSLLILPYVIWLIIATSLNAYILFN